MLKRRSVSPHVLIMMETRKGRRGRTVDQDAYKNQFARGHAQGVPAKAVAEERSGFCSAGSGGGHY